MCSFEHLEPDVFRQRRVAMIALADERRLATALKPSRVRRARARRRVRVGAASPGRLSPSPLFR
jgi:hypothetical protein